MTCKKFFQQFEPAIRDRFQRAKRDAGITACGIRLEIDEKPVISATLAEFAALTDERVVRITWNGIASLWASSQAFARITRLMFEESRKGKDRLEITPGSVVEAGMAAHELAKMVCTQDLINEDGKTLWVQGAPEARVAPNDQDSITGNALFYAALAFILRHEVAHITLGHVPSIPDDQIKNERAADLQAADWLRGDRKADDTRPPGQAPTGEEKELEQRALAVVLGVLWIATFEIRSRQPSRVHPPIADRIYKTLKRMHLPKDSAAIEIAAHGIQFMVAPDNPFQTSLDFLQEATPRLNRFMQEISH
jgi:Peptidase U49